MREPDGTNTQKQKQKQIMGNMKCIKRTKIILVPYPAQGHISPMLKLASIFVNQLGMEPVMVTPDFIHRRIKPTTYCDHPDEGKISFISFPDGLELEEGSSPDFFAVEEVMEGINNNMAGHLERLVCKLNGVDGDGIVCMVVDLLASAAIEVGHRCGVPVAGFWPAMLATYQLIAAIPDLLNTGFISDDGSPQYISPTRFLPNQPLLTAEELPWLIGTPAQRKARFKFWTRTLERCRKLQWILNNSFPMEHYCLDHEQSKKDHAVLIKKVNVNMDNPPTVIPIGPLSKHALMSENQSLWEEDRSCLKWLDKQNPSSVIYISFGSWVSVRDGKVKNLSVALEAIDQPFIWVLKSSWQEWLPLGFRERVSRKGMVVSWAPQFEVLQHKAIGSYLTHCGWNSTLEAIQCQKRLLCYPIGGDQFLNCAYIVEKWGIGLKLNKFEPKEIQDGLRRVMQDHEMSNRVKRLRERCMGELATSTVMANIRTFIGNLNKSNESSIELALI